LRHQLDAEIDGERMLVHLESLDDASWEVLQNGEIVELTGTLRRPDAAKGLAAMQDLGLIDAIADELRNSDEMPSDPDAQAGMAMFEAMFRKIGESAKSRNAAVVVVELAATPEYRFVATLKRDFMRTGVEDLEDLSGEVKVLGKIQRKINENDPPIGIEGLVPGFESFKGLMELSSDVELEDDEESIGYPAATLLPIAIWQ
jgi:hypothetical protein